MTLAVIVSLGALLRAVWYRDWGRSSVDRREPVGEDAESWDSGQTLCQVLLRRGQCLVYVALEEHLNTSKSLTFPVAMLLRVERVADARGDSGAP